MHLYLLRGLNRADLRMQLRGLNYSTHSSCYELDGYLYIVVQIEEMIANPQLATIILANQVPMVQAFTALQLLQDWAISEIQHSLNFLSFEEKATNLVNACQIMHNGSELRRSYLPLGEIMLIVNCTPDSFSADGSLDVMANLLRITQALTAGVSIIDVGAESTRPNAAKLSSDEEIARLSPLLAELQGLRSQFNFKISLDSYQADTVKYFLPQIDIVNDVSGKLDHTSLRPCAEQKKIYVGMHSLSVPANPCLIMPNYPDPLQQIALWGEKKLEQLQDLGFTSEQICLDVGIGFNKSSAQSWHILRNFSSLLKLGVPLLIGHSRKRFLNKICSTELANRDLESAAIANILLSGRVDYVRVHNYQLLHSLARVSNQF